MAGEKLTTAIYDVAIIGGGIVGSGVFRDLSLHHKSAIIIDQNDFNSQTSAGSSKMLHGGVRYLENFDFALVFEALYEKNLWLKLAPHIVKESPFYLPVYKESKWPLFLLKIGLFLYDLLSLFKNTPHKTYNKSDTQRILPGIKSDNLKGCGMYFDSIVDDHKLGLECIYDGLVNENCHALNYHQVTRLEFREDIYHIELIDMINQSVSIIRAKNIVCATGPFTDQFMQKMQLPWKPVLLPSKGSHLWLHRKALAITSPMVLQTKDNRIIFVIPQRRAILVGTTEIPLKEDENFFNLTASREEIDYLLQEVNSCFPDAHVTDDHVLASFAAVRPLVQDGHNSAKVSRKHKVYTPAKNFYVIVGGKYTTFRKMAQDLNRKMFNDNKWVYNKNLTLKPLRHLSLVTNPQECQFDDSKLDQICADELVRTKEDLIQRRLSLPHISFLENRHQRKVVEEYQLKPVGKSK